eukprot:1286590-Pleurochrysis_carterae.AAC.1
MHTYDRFRVLARLRRCTFCASSTCKFVYRQTHVRVRVCMHSYTLNSARSHAAVEHECAQLGVHA